ncbi:hypothetical protein BKA24_001815 [Microbacterium marinum]|uniref:Uncharacterized protein n=1 Tax=Microbacterium marinum TaxID=421115 RepID=A0A7W7BQR7_9MICO|nr:hypothetical protein [Microbacterium marinum]MBB4667106.1 hypothetical protein [Microbacterium marinum]
MTVDFAALLRNPRDVEAPAGSINAALLALPQQRTHTHDLKGALLYFPRTDQVMVPYEYRVGGWAVVVVHNGPRAPKHDGSDGRTAGDFVYKPNGHSLFISELEMQTAIEMKATDTFHLTVYIGGDLERDVDMTPPPWGGDQNLEGVTRLAEVNRGHGNIVEVHQETTFSGGDWWEVQV